jgi:hypothetical protein
METMKIYTNKLKVLDEFDKKIQKVELLKDIPKEDNKDIPKEDKNKYEFQVLESTLQKFKGYTVLLDINKNIPDMRIKVKKGNYIKEFSFDLMIEKDDYIEFKNSHMTLRIGVIKNNVERIKWKNL